MSTIDVNLGTSIEAGFVSIIDLEEDFNKKVESGFASHFKDSPVESSIPAHLILVEECSVNENEAFTPEDLANLFRQFSHQVVRKNLEEPLTLTQEEFQPLSEAVANLPGKDRLLRAKMKIRYSDEKVLSCYITPEQFEVLLSKTKPVAVQFEGSSEKWFSL